jgi:hypothetical protein
MKTPSLLATQRMTGVFVEGSEVQGLSGLSEREDRKKRALAGIVNQARRSPDAGPALEPLAKDSLCRACHIARL